MKTYQSIEGGTIRLFSEVFNEDITSKTTLDSLFDGVGFDEAEIIYGIEAQFGVSIRGITIKDSTVGDVIDLIADKLKVSKPTNATKPNFLSRAKKFFSHAPKP